MKSLFHYCSVDTFQAIIENRSLRLSSLRLSNDSAEGKLVHAIINELARKDKLSNELISHLEFNLTYLEEYFEGLGFCLSETGDLLSQWRGYAADGTGFSIGFNQKYFELLSKKLIKNGKSSFTLQKVRYKTIDQIKLTDPIYQKIKIILLDPNFKYPYPQGLLDSRTEQEIQEGKDLYRRLSQAIFLHMMDLIPMLYALKTEAFKEEKEWRLITNLTKSDGEPCYFKALSNRLVPFKTINLIDLNTIPLVEVIIGPKNITPVNVVERFLNQNGFKNVKVFKSTATYR